jgi:hypothetical protein
MKAAQTRTKSGASCEARANFGRARTITTRRSAEARTSCYVQSNQTDADVRTDDPLAERGTLVRAGAGLSHELRRAHEKKKRKKKNIVQAQGQAAAARAEERGRAGRSADAEGCGGVDFGICRVRRGAGAEAGRRLFAFPSPQLLPCGFAS